MSWPARPRQGDRLLVRKWASSRIVRTDHLPDIAVVRATTRSTTATCGWAAWCGELGHPEPLGIGWAELWEYAPAEDVAKAQLAGLCGL